jgi:uncharacterized protein YggE
MQTKSPMKNILLTFMLMYIALFAMAQNEKPTIDVTGSAEMEVTPNIIVLSVTLTEYEENKVKIPLERIDNDFAGVVKSSNITSDKISISNFGINSIYERKHSRESYAQKTYEITFSKTENAVSFLKNLKGIKVEYVNIVKMSHTDIEKYRLELKIEALKAAKQKAETLLNAIGNKLGKVSHIQEAQDFGSYSYRNSLTSNHLLQDDSGEYQDHEGIKRIKLRFEMSASFEIE